MILLIVNDSIQVVNSTNNYLEGFKILALGITAIVGVVTIYWIIYQIKQARKNNKEKEKKNLYEEKQRKLSIKPEFVLGNYGYDHIENYLFLKLTVIGGSAQLDNIENSHSDFVSISPDNYALKELTNIDDWIVLTVTTNSVNQTNVGITNLSFNLVYRDIKDNKYIQKIEGSYAEGIKLQKPKEILATRQSQRFKPF